MELDGIDIQTIKHALMAYRDKIDDNIRYAMSNGISPLRVGDINEVECINRALNKIRNSTYEAQP